MYTIESYKVESVCKRTVLGAIPININANINCININTKKSKN